MGQGIKYGIAAVGTLLLLTILSWNADEPKKAEAETIKPGLVMEGGTLNAAPKTEVQVTPVAPKPAPSAIKPTPSAVVPNLASAKPAATVDYSATNTPIKAGGITTSLVQKPGKALEKPLLAGSAPVAPTKPIEQDKKSEPVAVIAPSSDAGAPDRSSWQKYSVKSGETLFAIARKTMGNGMHWKAIMRANPRLKSPGHLRTGMTLLIPTKQFAASSKSAPVIAAKPTTSKPRARVAVEEADAGDHEVGSSTYVVKAGDTLSKIAAKKLGSRKKWRKLYNANRGVLKSPNHLRAGQKLTIPAR